MKEELLREDEVRTFVRDGKEYASLDGNEVEILSPTPSTDFSKLTPQQSASVFELYKIISRLLPLEGRDYDMKISFGDDPSAPSISFTPKNELGSIWTSYLSRHIAEEVAKLGRK